MKVIDVIRDVLNGRATIGTYVIESPKQLDMTAKIVNGRVTIEFGKNRPIFISTFVVKIKFPIEYISFQDDMMYVKPEQWFEVAINMQELQENNK